MSDRTTKLLNRKDTADFLAASGFPVTWKTLAALASADDGPPYRMFGRHALYDQDAALAWALARLRPSRGDVRRGTYLTRDMRPADR
jgi:hypothetical protein